MEATENSLIEVFLCKDFIVLSRGQSSLWCCRKSGEISLGIEVDYNQLDSPVRLGKVWGYIGKMRFFTDGEWKLLLITQAYCVGNLPQGGNVYCIDRIAIIPLTIDPSSEMIGIEVPEQPEVASGINSALTASLGISMGMDVGIMFASSSSNSLNASLGRPPSPSLGEKIVKNLTDREKPKELRDREKVERRLTEALLWMFNDSRSFYFSVDFDLTQSLQRKTAGSAVNIDVQLPFWQKLDERFFWNKWMISDLIGDSYQGELSDPWILPIIQGYVEVRKIAINSKRTPDILQPGWNSKYAEKRKILNSDLDSSLKTLHPPSTDTKRDEETDDYDCPPSEDIGSGYESDSESGDSDVDRASFTTDDILDELIDKDQLEATREQSKRVRVIQEEPEEEKNDATKEENKQEATKEESKELDEETNELEVTKVETKELEAKKGESDEQGAPNKETEDFDATKETTELEVTRDGPKEMESEQREDNVRITINDYSNTAKNEACDESAERPIQSVAEGDIHYRSGDEQCASVPPLSSLCTSVLVTYPSENESDSNRVKSDKLGANNEPLLSNIDSDYFDRSSSPCGNRPSEDSEGWVAVKRMADDSVVDEEKGTNEKEDRPSPTFTLAIISRRSRHRAGTRYRRRGVDKDGHVANYVETEMLVQCGTHVVSYVIVRGSVPVYWTQPGTKYRPPPIIENDEEETQVAFHKHFNEQLDLYREVSVVNLVKQAGREKVLADAYEHHILLMNNPLVTYIVFDFHQHYKSNQSVGLKHLLKKTHDIIKNMKFCWLDTDQSSSVLCKQESVFRVNCMDCLDRTNVIQSVFARDILQSALQKLGVITFEEKLEGSMLISFQEVWGNNGDFISKQYTGTIAMKGDITRYGERKLSGLMKDGYNSAQRYYMNLFRDTYRQVLIDLMQGINPADAFASLPSSMRGADELDDGLSVQDTSDPTPSVSSSVTTNPSNVLEDDSPMCLLHREEAVTDIIQHCKNELFPNKSLHLQAWALVEAAGYSFVESSQKEELCVLIQCRESSQLCIISYSLEIEQIVCFMRIPMDKLQKIVIGPLGMYNLRSAKRLHMRVYYSLFDNSVCYLTFRTVSFTSTEEDRAILLGIADALAYLQPDILVMEHKLTKKKSPNHEGIIYMVLPQTWTKKWAEIGPQSENDSESADRSCDDHKSASSVHRTTAETLEGDNKANTQQALSKEERTSSPDCKEEEEEENEEALVRTKQSDSDYNPLRLRSQSFDDIMSSIKVISPTSTEAPGIPLLTVSSNNDQTSTTFIPLESGGSVSESEECELLRNKVQGMRSICSDSRLVFEEESVRDDGGSQGLHIESKNGSLKRSSSDTLINSVHPSGESELIGKFTKFTNRLFETLRSPGKPSKPGTSSQSLAKTHQRNTGFSLMQAQLKTNFEANNDSDTSTNSQFKSQVSQKLLSVRQRFKAGWSKSPQTEPMEDEAKKQEKRARSKSKILIV